MRRRELSPFSATRRRRGPSLRLCNSPAMPVIGLLSSVAFETRRDQDLRISRGLKEPGYVEGRPASRRKQEIIVVTRHTTKRQRDLICLGAARAIIGIWLTAALTCCTFTMATAAADLYRAQAIVTGQGEANRIIGFAACLEDVLIKISGAQRLAGARRLAAYKAKAKSFVSAFSYHDQMSGSPTRDEQGTDRPYDLIVDFDETRIDDILKAVGPKPWLSHRPSLEPLSRCNKA